MVEQFATTNIFAAPKRTSEAICITTNGIVKRDGHAVMGAGIAKQANILFHCSRDLGNLLRACGNHAFHLGLKYAYGHMYHVFSFPTKHNWRDNSNLDLIRQSAEELVELCNQHRITTCYLPPAGCGLGSLDWETQVKPVLAPILDDRFIIILRQQ